MSLPAKNGSQFVSHNGNARLRMLTHHHARVEHSRKNFLLSRMSVRISSTSKFHSVLNVLFVIFIQPFSY